MAKLWPYRAKLRPKLAYLSPAKLGALKMPSLGPKRPSPGPKLAELGVGANTDCVWDGFLN